MGRERSRDRLRDGWGAHGRDVFAALGRGRIRRKRIDESDCRLWHLRTSLRSPNTSSRASHCGLSRPAPCLRSSAGHLL